MRSPRPEPGNSGPPLTPSREASALLFCGHSREAVAVSVTVAFAVARTSRSATERGNAIMLSTLKCPVIALEEHYWDKELAALFVGAEGVRDPEMLKRLYDLGEVRLKEMDEAGIDGQVLSHGGPPGEKDSGAGTIAVTRRVKDRPRA